MNWVTFVTRSLWGLWAWLSFTLACVFSLIVALIVPGPHQRQRLVTHASRIIFVLSGVKVSVRGIDNLPLGSCVVVANHASYVDGILLKGYLPSRFNFVIKGEMRNIPVVHFLLHRSGAKFVERKEAIGSSRDARKLVKAAQGGESLGFFPEGTFILEPGVGRFRPGAFVAALKGEMSQSLFPGLAECCPPESYYRGHLTSSSTYSQLSCQAMLASSRPGSWLRPLVNRFLPHSMNLICSPMKDNSDYPLLLHTL